MTIEEVSKLTDEELRAKVAVLNGWAFAPQNGPLSSPWRDTKLPAWDEAKGWIGRAPLPPDYANDLNAMHEAEKRFSGVQQDQYCNLLGWPADNAPHAAWKVASATARKRAEAFVLTLSQ